MVLVFENGALRSHLSSLLCFSFLSLSASRNKYSQNGVRKTLPKFGHIIVMAKIVRNCSEAVKKVQIVSVNLPQTVQNCMQTTCVLRNCHLSAISCSLSFKSKTLVGAGILSNQVRFYSKSQDRGSNQKGKKGGHHHHPDVSDEELAEFINAGHLHKQMNHAIDILKEEYVKNLSLRTNAGAFESLHVEVDGDKFMMNEVAQIGRKGGQTIVLNFSDFPTAIPSALKALQASGLGINPQQEGTTIYLPIPKVTTEHRENLAKNAKALANKTKIVIKDIQNRYIKDAKKHTEKPADCCYAVQQKIHALAEDYIAQVDTLMSDKQKELLGK